MSTIKQINIQTPLGETISRDIGADALNIDYDNSSSELESTNVQNAIDELKDDLSNLSSTLENLDDVNLSNLQNEQVIKYNSTSQKWENGNIDISGKADKVSNATNGNFASLDTNGNLTDSGKKASDFAGTGTATSSANGLMSSTDKTKLDNLGTASTKDVPTSGNAGSTQVVMGNDTRLSDSRKASDVYDWAKAATKPTYTASEVGAIASTAKGANNGVAELDSTGKVPSSQLPSFVDDVLEYDSLSAFPTTGEAGKIYIAKDTNKTYRWSGTVYAEISPSLALGETSSTAYRGDRGKIAYDHSQSTHARTDATKVEASSTNGNIKINGTETTVYTHPGSGTNPHGTTKSDVGLGNVGNYKAVSTVASQGLTDTEKSNARANIGAGTGNSNLALGETSSTAYYGDKGKTAYNHSQTTSGNPHNVTKSDVGLGNVGNFKAVSTVASQGLSDTEKANARANIGAGTGNSNLTLGTSSTTAYRGDYGNSAYAHAVTNKGSAFSSGLYKITTNSEGHVTAATAVAKADITGLGIPGSDTNTTYAFATGDSNGQIKVTPSGGSAQNVPVKGLGTAAYTASTDYRKYYTAEFGGGGSTDGYCLVCTLKIVASYVNKPVEIVLNERGRNSVARLNILFSSVNTNDPTLASFRVLALQNNYFIYKSATSTWQVYATKNEAWSGIKVIDYSIFDGGITVTWNMSNASLPSGATQATHFYATENTWRGVVDNLTSTADNLSLSANQGRVLKGLVDGKAASSHTHNYAGSSSAGGAANSLSGFENNNSSGKNANDVTYNAHTYYTSNGPATSLGASTNDGALYSQAYSGSWVAQIAQDYRNGGLFVRGKNNGTWQSWQKVYDTGHKPSKSDVGLGNVENKSSATIRGELTSSNVTTALGFTPGTGTVTQVKVGSTAYNPSSGVISLPAYPINTDTHRHINVNGTQILGNNTTALNFVDGSNVTITGSGGNVTIAATNTWRGIQNNLTSDSTTDSLSAAQGKVLKGLVDGKATKPTVKSATLAANATSVTFTGIPTSGNNMIDFFITDGANYTAINTATSGQITLTYAASSSARTVYCRIEGV